MNAQRDAIIGGVSYADDDKSQMFEAFATDVAQVR